MGKKIRLTESELINLLERIVTEHKKEEKEDEVWEKQQKIRSLPKYGAMNVPKPSDKYSMVLENHIESKRLKFINGERVVVSEGPFASFEGIISDIKGEKVDIEVKIFGRNTTVSLTLEQIEKL